MQKSTKQRLGIFGASVAAFTLILYIVADQKERRDAFIEYKEKYEIKTRVDENATHKIITRYNSEGLVSISTYEKREIRIAPDFKNMTTEQIIAIHKAYNEGKE